LQTSNLILDFEFDQYLESHKHVINIIMGFRDMGCYNHDAPFSSKALITSAHVGGYDANPTITISSALEFALSYLIAVFDEQYESIPDDEIALLARKFYALHKFHKERRRSPRGELRVSRHHPLYRRLPQEEEARLLQQV
jgi:hypothetical protein